MQSRGEQQRDLYRGFGDGLAQAFELVATPALFAFLGYLLDRAVGTKILFALVFGAFVLGYQIWKMWRLYVIKMEKEEAARAKAAGR